MLRKEIQDFTEGVGTLLKMKLKFQVPHKICRASLYTTSMSAIRRVIDKQDQTLHS